MQIMRHLSYLIVNIATTPTLSLFQCDRPFSAWLFHVKYVVRTSILFRLKELQIDYVLSKGPTPLTLPSWNLTMTATLCVLQHLYGRQNQLTSPSFLLEFSCHC